MYKDTALNLTAQTTLGEGLRHILARCSTNGNTRHMTSRTLPNTLPSLCVLLPSPFDRHQRECNLLQNVFVDRNSDCCVQQSKQPSSLKHQIMRTFWSEWLWLNLIRIHSRYKLHETTRWYYLLSWTQHLKCTSNEVGMDIFEFTW